MNAPIVTAQSSELIVSTKPEKLDQLRTDINQCTDLLEEAMRRSIQHGLRLGELLTNAKALVERRKWLHWFTESEFRFTERTAQRYMKLFEHWPTIEARIDADPNRLLLDLTLNDALSELRSLNDQSSAATKNLESPTEESDNAVAADATSGSSLGSPPMASIVEPASDRWLTPDYIVDAAVHTLNVIDLDPASDGSHIPAQTHYTITDNGLRDDRPWHGKVFLNPPSNDKSIIEFVGRLVKEHQAEHVTEAILVLPAMTDTKWFRNLSNLMRCFLTKPEFGQYDVEGPLVAFYLGERINNFYAVFSKLGGLFVPYRPSNHEETKKKRPRLFSRGDK